MLSGRAATAPTTKTMLVVVTLSGRELAALGKRHGREDFAECDLKKKMLVVRATATE